MRKLIFFIFILTVNSISGQLHSSEQNDALAFDDKPLESPLHTPDWFKLSFLDLKENLEEANASNRGLIIYFERKNCAYCKAQLEVNWGIDDIVEYTKEHFDVITINVRGQRKVTDFDGQIYTENEYAVIKQTNFTPSFIIYDNKGEKALQLYGFRPPYQFRAALEYAIDRHYKKQSFRSYLARAQNAMSFGQDELNESEVFSTVTNLDRTKAQKQTPLAVFFEHPNCHACDVLHAGPMNEAEILHKLQKMEVVQIDIGLKDTITTPSGDLTTNKAWAEQLDISFAPAIIFFDTKGHEIIRIESVVRFNRLNNVIQYVLEEGYLSYPTFQRWREAQK